MAGEFKESDIETIFRHALSLEQGGSRKHATLLFQLVATHSTDSENSRLASESIQRMNSLSK